MPILRNWVPPMMNMASDTTIIRAMLVKPFWYTARPKTATTMALHTTPLVLTPPEIWFFCMILASTSTRASLSISAGWMVMPPMGMARMASLRRTPNIDAYTTSPRQMTAMGHVRLRKNL